MTLWAVLQVFIALYNSFVWVKEFIIHGKSNLVTSETQQYSIDVISIKFIIIISLFVFHKKTQHTELKRQIGTNCTFSVYKGESWDHHKSSTADFLFETSSCIMQSLGNKSSVMHRFQKPLLPLLCSSRQTDSKEPTWDKVSQERNHHALLCLYKSLTWVFLIHSVTRWCFVCSSVDIYKLLNLNVVLSLLRALTNTFSFGRWNILFLLDAETVLLDEQTNTLFKGICPVWIQPTMAPTLLVWLDLTNLTDRLWKHWHQLRSSD